MNRVWILDSDFPLGVYASLKLAKAVVLRQFSDATFNESDPQEIQVIYNDSDKRTDLRILEFMIQEEA